MRKIDTWICCNAAARLVKQQQTKKRFVKEYQRNLDLYEFHAKKVLTEDIQGLTCVEKQNRIPALKISAVLHEVLCNDKPKWGKFLHLVGKEAQIILENTSNLWLSFRENCLDNELVKTFYSTQGVLDEGDAIERASLYYLLFRSCPVADELADTQYMQDVERWCFEKRESRKKSEEQQLQFFLKHGVPHERNIEILAAQALNYSNNISLAYEDEEDGPSVMEYHYDKDVARATFFGGSLFCQAVRDGGVSPGNFIWPMISKQRFQEAQKSAAGSISFAHLTPDSDNRLPVNAYSFDKIPNLKILPDGTISTSCENAEELLHSIDIYNTLIPLALCIQSLSAAYLEEFRANLYRETFGVAQEEDKAFGAAARYEKRIETLQKELEENRKTQKRLEQEVTQKSDLLEKSRKRENALSVKLGYAQEEIDSLLEQLPEPSESADTCSAELKEGPPEKVGEETEITLEPSPSFRRELQALFKKYRVVIVGGHQNLIKRLPPIYPELRCIGNGDLASCDALLKNADIVLFKTDNLSHSLYNKCKSLAVHNNIPFGYIPNVVSMSRLEQSLFEQISVLVS